MRLQELKEVLFRQIVAALEVDSNEGLGQPTLHNAIQHLEKTKVFCMSHETGLTVIEVFGILKLSLLIYAGIFRSPNLGLTWLSKPST